MIKKMTALFATTTLLFSSSIALSQTLTTYDEIADSLAAARPVYVSIQAEKCQLAPDSTNKYNIKRLGVKIPDLYERESTFNGGKKMKMLGSGNNGLFGNNKFNWSRELILIYEDGTVMWFNDDVNPTTFDLIERTRFTCKLSTDGSGGVTVTQLNQM